METSNPVGNNSQSANKSYIPIASGSYSMPNGGHSECDSAQGHIGNFGSDEKLHSNTEHHMYEVTPMKAKQSSSTPNSNSIYN